MDPVEAKLFLGATLVLFALADAHTIQGCPGYAAHLAVAPTVAAQTLPTPRLVRPNADEAARPANEVSVQLGRGVG